MENEDTPLPEYCSSFPPNRLLSPDILGELEAFEKRTGVCKTFLVNAAIAAALDHFSRNEYIQLPIYLKVADKPPGNIVRIWDYLAPSQPPAKPTG